MESLHNFLVELDKLKLVQRRSFVSDRSRYENSAEHSWHLAMAILTLQEKFDLEIDTFRAVKMALVHDVCEIDAGDISIFDTNRDKVAAAEALCIERIANFPEKFAAQISELWYEYEAQQTQESCWVRVADRMLPFMLNISTQGASWREMEISASQVREIIAFIQQQSPEVHRYMSEKIDMAVESGWLADK